MVGEHRFSADLRLHHRAEFDRVFASPVRSSDRYFTILARRNDLGRARLGLAISKRVVRRAVDRNRLRRLAREVFRVHPELADADYIVLARSAARGASNAELRQSLERLFSRTQPSAGRD